MLDGGGGSGSVCGLRGEKRRPKKKTRKDHTQNGATFCQEDIRGGDALRREEDTLTFKKNESKNRALPTGNRSLKKG